MRLKNPIESEIDMSQSTIINIRQKVKPAMKVTSSPEMILGKSI
jgi:hypothetical protein